MTRGGEKCTTFADCKALAEAGTDLDYDGFSGPLEFIDAGEPSQASILILEFDETGTIVESGSVEVPLVSDDSVASPAATTPLPSSPGPRPETRIDPMPTRTSATAARVRIDPHRCLSTRVSASG